MSCIRFPLLCSLPSGLHRHRFPALRVAEEWERYFLCKWVVVLSRHRGRSTQTCGSVCGAVILSHCTSELCGSQTRGPRPVVAWWSPHPSPCASSGWPVPCAASVAAEEAPSATNTCSSAREGAHLPITQACVCCLCIPRTCWTYVIFRQCPSVPTCSLHNARLCLSPPLPLTPSPPRIPLSPVLSRYSTELD